MAEDVGALTRSSPVGGCAVDPSELLQPGRVALAVREVAHADLYRNNAFRLSGLPVDSTLRKLRRLSTELEAASRLGSTVPRPAGPLPVSPPPEPAVVLDALRRSREPVRRIVDEFFWFWPFPSGGLGGTSLHKAMRRWNELADPDGGVGDDDVDPTSRAIAIHNQAVAAHVLALEDGSESPARLAEQWRDTYRGWRRVLADDECWRWLAGRVTAIDDPRLRVDSVAEIRRELPTVLLAIHAGLATDAASTPRSPSSARNSASNNTARHGTPAGRHLAAMRKSGFDAAVIERALVAAVEPYTARLRALSERSRAATGGPDGYQSAYAALVKESDADLRVLRGLLGKDHPSVAGIVDDLASRMHELVVRDVNERPNDSRAALPDVQLLIDRLDRAQDLAAGVHVKEQIAQDIRTLLANQVVASCNSALKKSQANPRAGLGLHRKLLDDTSDARKHLARLDDGDRSVQDEVAGTAFVMLVSYFNSTRDGESTLPALRIVQKLASNLQLRDRISDAIGKVTLAAPSAPPSLMHTLRDPFWPSASVARDAQVAEDAQRYISIMTEVDAGRSPEGMPLPRDPGMRQHLERKLATLVRTCAFCGHGTSARRDVVMVPKHGDEDEGRKHVTVPCCERCARKPLAPNLFTGIIGPVFGPMTLLMVLIATIQFGMANMSVGQKILGIALLIAGLAWSCMSLARWSRRKMVSRHDAVYESILDGWRIVG